MVVMEDDPVITYKATKSHFMSGDVEKYKERVIIRHDIFLQSILPAGSYTKLYSYTHLLNGFALHATSEETIEILRNTRRIRLLQEDVKISKLTTHTPDYLGISAGAWPAVGGAENAGGGVVIGFVDTGINPNHPSFANLRPKSSPKSTKYKGKCQIGEGFSVSSCNGKIIGAQFFARAAIAAGDFNASCDYASPFDTDGHGSHTASTAAGNYRIAVLSNGYNYGYASGMAPGARIAVYKAVYSFGGYMSDVVAAIDQAVEDGVDILSLSIGPSAIPTGPASFLDILEMELLFAARAGVSVIQAAGNGGPDESSVLSFSPWVISVAASTTDRKYNNSLVLGSGDTLSGAGLSPPTPADGGLCPIAAAEDVAGGNGSYIASQDCQRPELFIPSLAEGKLIICSYSGDFILTPASITAIADAVKEIGAAGFIFTSDRSASGRPMQGPMLPLSVPGIFLCDREASQALWEYYDSQTTRSMNGQVLSFDAMGQIMDGRQAVFSGEPPAVAAYSSRGPDVNNAFMQTADVLKPDVIAPGSSIWAAWSPVSQNDDYIRGEDFAMVSGTSMATPHVAGVAAIIRQKHPAWSPAAVASAITTSAAATSPGGAPLLAQRASGDFSAATPFDAGAGAVNPAGALDPGLVFDAGFNHYLQFLCAVPGVDEESVRRAAGAGCPAARTEWCSDLNTASVTVASLVGSRKVVRRVTSVAAEEEGYRVSVRAPAGVAVTVAPTEFGIAPNGTKALRILLEAKEALNAYTFGEIVLKGDKKHVVKIPMAVFVRSTRGN
ncbi:Subtilisin-like protease [Apostasia shenzhenica]|uniref:Subtilisin-like protease n=1 Tax=Apostasia shenzhenica TaxID=1088818 RepID=A0A2I0ATL6_9ASPA|nr:Subtilisin-like protease [Apostasia shenzhenica]